MYCGHIRNILVFRKYVLKNLRIKGHDMCNLRFFLDSSSHSDSQDPHRPHLVLLYSEATGWELQLPRSWVSRIILLQKSVLQSYWGLGLQHMNIGEHSSVHEKEEEEREREALRERSLQSS